MVNTASATAATVGALAVMNPLPPLVLWSMLYEEVTDNKPPLSDNWPQTNEEVYPYTNREHSIDDSFYRNIWVAHTKEDFDKNQSTILGAIDSSDIILLEWHKGNAPYFDQLAKLCAKRGKEVYFIDDQNSINLTVAILCTFLGTIFACKSILNHKELQTVDWLKIQSRRNFLVAMLWMNSLVATYPVMYGQAMNLPYRWQYDVSYVIDARTVIMLENIFTLIKQYKGKRILSITGNTHAQGFEHYMENQDDFDMRKYIYSHTYGLFSSGPKKFEK